MFKRNDNSFYQWIQEQFDIETLQNIYERGCINGINGLYYYSETT